MVMQIANTLLNHLFKKDELKFKQRLDSKVKHSDEEKLRANARLEQIDKHITNILAIKCFCSWDEYIKYGVSGFGIEKYDKKVSALKDGLEALINDSCKQELAYSENISDSVLELNTIFYAATRVWHESVQGQDHDGEKGQAAGNFQLSMITAKSLVDSLKTMRNELVSNN
jgi:hypothetical protein